MKAKNMQEKEINNIVKKITKELNNLPLNVSSINLLKNLKKQLSEYLNKQDFLKWKTIVKSQYNNIEQDEYLSDIDQSLTNELDDTFDTLDKEKSFYFYSNQEDEEIDDETIENFNLEEEQTEIFYFDPILLGQILH